MKRCSERVESALGYLDTSGRPAGFHAAGNVHRVPPDIVDKPFSTNQTGDYRAGVYSNSQAEPTLTCHLARLGQHGPCKCHGCLGMVRTRVGQPGRSHIGVTYGLDLLDTVLIRQFVKTRKQLSKSLDQCDRRGARREFREIDDISEDDRRHIDAIGDHFFPISEPLHHLSRQNCIKERIGALLLEFDLRQIAPFPLAPTAAFKTGGYARTQQHRIDRFVEIVFGSCLDATDNGVIDLSGPKS